jgi:hypothetical protein
VYLSIAASIIVYCSSVKAGYRCTCIFRTFQTTEFRHFLKNCTVIAESIPSASSASIRPASDQFRHRAKRAQLHSRMRTFKIVHTFSSVRTQHAKLCSTLTAALTRSCRAEEIRCNSFCAVPCRPTRSNRPTYSTRPNVSVTKE